MKIAYYTAWTFPAKKASHVNVIRMCEAFAKAGYRVTLIVSEKPEQDIMEYYGIGHPFKVVAMPTRKGNNRWTRAFFFGLKLLKLIFGNYDYIITRRKDRALLFLSTPVILELHEYKITKTVEDLLKMPNLAAIPVITEPIRDDYAENYPFLADKLIVAPDAATAPSERFFSDINRCETVGYVGHLYEGRGIDIIAELAKAFPQFKFNIIGGEEEHVDLWKSRCSDIENLKFLGHVPHGKLGEYYKDIDIALAPYQDVVRWGNRTDVDTSKHMSPLKIFEYMSFRKPMLVSDSPVLYEVLRDEETCLFCEKANIESWKSQLKRLIDDVELRRKLSTQAYDDFIENYTWDVRVKRIMEFVEKQDMPKRGVCRGFLHILVLIVKKSFGRIIKHKKFMQRCW